MLAIGAFAGLREAEIKRLDWNEVNLKPWLHRSESKQSEDGDDGASFVSSRTSRLARALRCNDLAL